MPNPPSHSKAENELGDTPKREELDAAINQARLTLLKGLSLPTSTPDDHPRLNGLTPPFKAQLRQKSKELLIEEEVQRRRCVYFRHENMAVFDGVLDRRAIKMNLANEGFEARKKDEEVAARKRKAEDDARWEGEFTYFLYGSPRRSSCPPHRNPGTARGQLAHLHQYIEKEEKAEGRRSWLKSYSILFRHPAQCLYLSISRPGN